MLQNLASPSTASARCRRGDNIWQS